MLFAHHVRVLRILAWGFLPQPPHLQSFLASLWGVEDPAQGSADLGSKVTSARLNLGVGQSEWPRLSPPALPWWGHLRAPGQEWWLSEQGVSDM